MIKATTNEPAKWRRPVAALALLWNLMGCAAYLSDVTLKPEDVAKMSADMQQLYASRAAWAVSATAIAVWGGAVGCVGLIMRRSWALPVLVASLLGVIVQDIGLFLLTDAGRVGGAVVYVLQGIVLAVAVGLVIMARSAD